MHLLPQTVAQIGSSKVHEMTLRSFEDRLGTVKIACRSNGDTAQRSNKLDGSLTYSPTCSGDQDNLARFELPSLQQCKPRSLCGESHSGGINKTHLGRQRKAQAFFGDYLSGIRSVLHMHENAVSDAQPFHARANRIHYAGTLLARSKRRGRRNLVSASDYQEVWIVDHRRLEVHNDLSSARSQIRNFLNLMTLQRTWLSNLN